MRTIKLRLYTSDVVRKISALIFVLIYSLVPYSVTGLNTGCKCGYTEFICSCCQNAQPPKDKGCFTEYDCSINDDSYEQPPAISLSFFRLPVTPVLLGYVDCRNDGMCFPGHRPPL
jgi:hypothetical protein